MRAADGTQGHEIWEKGEKMNRRTFEEMVSYFNQTVADMDVDRKYKMELLGMITAILQRHDEDMKHAPTIEERKTGKWIHTDTQAGYDINGDLVWADMMKCETCGFEIDVIQGHVAQYNFCPNCGAKMEGESD